MLWTYLIAGVVALVVLLLLFRMVWRVAEPNEALIISGLGAHASQEQGNDTLGFKISDKTDMMEFVRCSADHHSIAMARGNGPTLNHMAYEMAAHVKLVDEAVSCTANIVVLERVLKGEGDEHVVVQNLRIEGRIARRQGAIAEASHLLKLFVKHVDSAMAKIGCV